MKRINKKKLNALKKTISLLTCCTLSVSVVAEYGSFGGNRKAAEVSARTLNEIQAEREANEQKIAELENQIASAEQAQTEHIVGIKPSPVISVPTYEYQTKYDNLYVESSSFAETESDKPIIYLTFDDGPSRNTAQVLDILKENNIKATFFVVNSDIDGHKELYRRIVNEGHTIGIHTYSHRYRDIYNSVDDYLADFEKIFNKIPSH